MGLWEDMNNYIGAIGSTAGSLLGLMTNPTPPDDTSVILLDGIPLPGIVQDEDVDQALDVEAVRIEGLSGSVKLTHGFTDGLLRYTLTLTTDDEPDGIAGAIGDLLSGDIASLGEELWGSNATAPLTATQKLEMLQTFFVAYDTNLDHRVWNITQEIANARGIKQVLFRRFGSIRLSRRDTIEATLEFIEYQPAMVLIETGQAAPPAPEATPAPDTGNPLEE